MQPGVFVAEVVDRIDQVPVEIPTAREAVERDRITEWCNCEEGLQTARSIVMADRIRVPEKELQHVRRVRDRKWCLEELGDFEVHYFVCAPFGRTRQNGTRKRTHAFDHDLVSVLAPQLQANGIVLHGNGHPLASLASGVRVRRRVRIVDVGFLSEIRLERLARHSVDADDRVIGIDLWPEALPLQSAAGPDEGTTAEARGEGLVRLDVEDRPRVQGVLASSRLLTATGITVRASSGRSDGGDEDQR
mmetsp:Transcript_109491/g.308917  ORF Transcript_109491/g.308917 Transcript_109491/m.308917 type:complete len:247 (+) Transcript_109491:545-1285(+)